MTSSESPLRIALLTYSTKPRGGVVHTLALAEALATAGHAVDVWSLARGGDGGFFRDIDPRVTLRLVHFGDVNGESVGERIVRSIAVLGDELNRPGSAEKYDVIHAQDCISANAARDCIRTIHHLDTFTTPELQACHERAIVRPYARICVSQAVADDVAAGWGFTPTVIGNGIDAARFAAAASDTPSATEARDAWREQLGDYVLAVGGIEPRKGSLELIEAMAQLQRRRPHIKFVVAGGETLFDYRDYREQVLGRAAELGVELMLLGPVADPELPSLVAAARAFAFPSVKEGFGLAAMEALAAGVPLVLRDLPVFHEVFGPTGRYASSAAEFAQQLERAIDQPDDERRQQGQALAAGHRWSDVAAAHVDFYRTHPMAARSGDR